MLRSTAVAVSAVALVLVQLSLSQHSQAAFDCTDRETGDHPISEGACSGQFYKCTEGVPTGHLFNCSATLVFDVISDRCLHRMYVDACGGTPTEAPEPSSTTQADEPPFSFNCEGRTDGDYSDSEAPCSEFYVSCSGGQTFYRQCVQGTKFDILSGECLEDQFVKLCGGDRTTKSPDLTTTLAPEDRFDCTELPDGLYPDSANFCSSTFFSCVDEAATALECPSDLFFDVASGRCVEIEFVDACGGESTTVPTITTTTASADEPTFSCDGLADGFYADPREEAQTEFGSCSTFFIVCSGAPFALVHECPAGLYFDAGELKCDFFADVPTCSGVVNEPTTTTEAPQGVPAPLGFCAVRETGDFEVEEGECSTDYVSCPPEGRGTLNTCPDGLYYDAEFNECGFFEAIPVCSGEDRPTTTTTEAASTTTIDPALVAFCATRDDGNYPRAEVCATSFVSCSGGRPDIFHCPGSTKYDPTEDACLDPSAVPGCEEFASGENECIGRVNGFYPVRDSCTTYVFCAEEQPTVLQCPVNEVFNTLSSSCQSVTDPLDGACGLPHDLPPFDCDGLTPGFYTLEGDCKNYYFCEKDGSAWAFSCEPSFAFDIARERCVPEVELDQCLPARVPDEAVQNFCLRQADGVFSNPIRCEEGIICLQQVAIEIVCTAPNMLFDSFMRQCTNELSAEANCVPEETVVFVDLEDFNLPQ